MAASDTKHDTHDKKLDQQKHASDDSHVKQAHDEVNKARHEDSGKTNLGDPNLKIDKAKGEVDFKDSKWNHSINAHVDKNEADANIDGLKAKFDKATGHSHMDGKDVTVEAGKDGQYTITDNKSNESLHWDNKQNTGFITDKDGNKIAEFNDRHDMKVWLKKNQTVDMVNGQGETAGSEADGDRKHHRHGDQNIFSDKSGNIAAVTANGTEIKAGKDGTIDVTDANGHNEKFKMVDGQLQPVDGSNADSLNGEIKWNGKDHKFELNGTSLEFKDGKWQASTQDSQGENVTVTSDGNKHTDTLHGGMFGDLINLPDCSFVDHGAKDAFLNGMRFDGKHHHHHFGDGVTIVNGAVVVLDNGINTVFSDHGGFAMYDKQMHRLFCANEKGVDVAGDLSINAGGLITDNKTGQSTSSSAYSKPSSSESSSATASQAHTTMQQASTELQEVNSKAQSGEVSTSDSQVLVGYYSQLGTLANEAMSTGDHGQAGQLLNEQSVVSNAIDKVTLQSEVQSRLPGYTPEQIHAIMQSSDPLGEARRMSTEQRFGKFGMDQQLEAMAS